MKLTERQQAFVRRLAVARYESAKERANGNPTAAGDHDALYDEYLCVAHDLLGARRAAAFDRLAVDLAAGWRAAAAAKAGTP